MPLLREPMLQKNSKNNKRKIVNGEGFNSQLGQSLHAAEALLAHSVGEKLPAEGACLNCQKRDGKFISCVKVPGRNHCSNCHWYRRSDCCQSEGGAEGLPKKPSEKRKAEPDQRPEEDGGKEKRQAVTTFELTCQKRVYTTSATILANHSPRHLQRYHRLQIHDAGK